jgi:hypothetical protein
MFTDGDVENGTPLFPPANADSAGEGKGVHNLVLLDGIAISMQQMVEQCCEQLVKCVES